MRTDKRTMINKVGQKMFLSWRPYLLLHFVRIGMVAMRVRAVVSKTLMGEGPQRGRERGEQEVEETGNSNKRSTKVYFIHRTTHKVSNSQGEDSLCCENGNRDKEGSLGAPLRQVTHTVNSHRHTKHPGNPTTYT